MKKIIIALFAIFVLQPLAAMEPVAKISDSQQFLLNEKLLHAVINELPNTVQTLLESGADANYSGGDEMDWPVLMEAIVINSEPICKLLLEHGADISLASEQGDNALDITVSRSSMPLCRLLITQAQFRIPSSKDVRKNSQTYIFNFLLALRRVCQRMPRDVRYHLLSVDRPTNGPLWQHVCNTPFGLHKNHFQILPMPVIKALIAGKVINEDKAIEAIKSHNTARILPLLPDARLVAQTKEVADLLDPNRFEDNFGADMKKHLKMQLQGN